VVQHLLSSGANIGVSDKDNNLPLFEACRNGHISVARVLISKGVPIDAQNIQVQILVIVSQGVNCHGNCCL
jgi:ankyrin repeat protein